METPDAVYDEVDSSAGVRWGNATSYCNMIDPVSVPGKKVASMTCKKPLPETGPVVSYAQDFTNWALHKLIKIPNPALRDENSSSFFEMAAEIGVTLKRTFGKFPKGLCTLFEDTRGRLSEAPSRSTKPVKRRRNRRKSGRGNASK